MNENNKEIFFYFLEEKRSFISSPATVQTGYKHVSSATVKGERTVQKQALRIKHDPISRHGQEVRNVPSSFQPTQLQEALVCAHRLANQLSTPGLTLGTDDD